MILKAKHHFIIYPFFQWYSGFITKKHYKIVQIIGHLKEKNMPILLISNHISWWDGFWAMYINQMVLHRKFHFMMLEEQIRKFWFFNFTGGFSVNKKSRSLVETLQYTSELLTDNKNMVLVFPQGEIQSLHNQNFQFENGLERILENKENAVQIVFMANLIDYFSNRKPSIYFHIEEYAGNEFDIKSIQKSYQAFYNQSVEKQKNLKN
jgi:1-acyl-sn-glycerol-3-phosphate acyltransferase